MSDSRNKWEEMLEEDKRQGIHNQLGGQELTIEQRINELEEKIDKHSKLIDEILKTLE